MCFLKTGQNSVNAYIIEKKTTTFLYTYANRSKILRIRSLSIYLFENMYVINYNVLFNLRFYDTMIHFTCYTSIFIILFVHASYMYNVHVAIVRTLLWRRACKEKINFYKTISKPNFFR